MRRGKYLLLRFEHGTQIVHLGMSGSLRSVAPGEFLRKHDHVEWIFDQAVLRLHDPRRFGAVLWHAAGDGPIEAHPLLARLGIEPFDPRFDGAWLHRHFQRHGAAIKQCCWPARLSSAWQYLRIRKPVPRPHQPEDAGQQAVARPLRPAGRVRARHAGRRPDLGRQYLARLCGRHRRAGRLLRDPRRRL